MAELGQEVDERARRGAKPSADGGSVVSPALAEATGIGLVEWRRGERDMGHQLTRMQEDLVERIIEISDYGDADQVVGEALRQLAEREHRLMRLRAAIAVGDADIARGNIVEWTPALHAEIFAEAKDAAKAGKKPKADVCP